MQDIDMLVYNTAGHAFVVIPLGRKEKSLKLVAICNALAIQIKLVVEAMPTQYMLYNISRIILDVIGMLQNAILILMLL
jgi:hypothetical protein